MIDVPEQNTMTESEYQAWWQLHRRIALEETLTPDEEARYNDGLQRLHATERLDSLLVELVDVRRQSIEQEAQLQHLLQRHDALMIQLRQLEDQLDDRSRRALEFATTS
ncbi:MAG: hypothetical protein OHK0029_33050 [Armatimonadaceae bacterium]